MRLSLAISLVLAGLLLIVLGILGIGFSFLLIVPAVFVSEAVWLVLIMFVLAVLCLFAGFGSFHMADRLYFDNTAARYPRGHCQSCGYDLRGSPSERCPECGTQR